MNKMYFKVVGGPCDGEEVYQPTYWDGRGHRPPSVIQLEPRRPIRLRVLEPAVSEQVERVTYYCHAWQDGDRRWYQYHPERPDYPFE